MAEKAVVDGCLSSDKQHAEAVMWRFLEMLCRQYGVSFMQMMESLHFLGLNHTNAFSFENASFSIRFHLATKLSKIQVDSHFTQQKTSVNTLKKVL